MGSLRITGQQRGPNGLTSLEVEVAGNDDADARLRFAQGAGPLPDSRVGALLIDGLPRVVVYRGAEEHGLLSLVGQRSSPLPAVPAGAPILDEPHVLALAPLLSILSNGLYGVSVTSEPVLPRVHVGFVTGDAGVVDIGVGADAGGVVIASLGRGAAALLAGRAGTGSQNGAWLISPNVVVDAPGFEPRHHDPGAREAFARSPHGVLADAALRHALALHRVETGGDVLGPFTEDRTEPAAQQARALAWDLRVEDDIDSVGEFSRVVVGEHTEFRAAVFAKGIFFELAFVSHDGRRVDEAVVRSNSRFRATGLRPAARALARTLRQLADEGG